MSAGPKKAAFEISFSNQDTEALGGRLLARHMLGRPLTKKRQREGEGCQGEAGESGTPPDLQGAVEASQKNAVPHLRWHAHLLFQGGCGSAALLLRAVWADQCSPRGFQKISEDSDEGVKREKESDCCE